MSGETWVFRHDDASDDGDSPEWITPDSGQYIDDFLCDQRPVSEYVLRAYESATRVGESLDYSSAEGRNGLFSQRFIDVIQPHMEPSFSLLPATLDGRPFFFLRHESSIDCLDYEGSDVRYFDCDPTDIKSIKSYSFHTEQLQRPLVFSLPGYYGRIFWTKPLVDICKDVGLTGVRFVSIDRINKNHGHIPFAEEDEPSD